MLRSGTPGGCRLFPDRQSPSSDGVPALITFLDAYDLLFKGAKSRNLVVGLGDDWWNRAEAK